MPMLPTTWFSTKSCVIWDNLKLAFGFSCNHYDPLKKFWLKIFKYIRKIKHQENQDKLKKFSKRYPISIYCN